MFKLHGCDPESCTCTDKSNWVSLSSLHTCETNGSTSAGLWKRSCLLSFKGVLSSFTSSTWKATWHRGIQKKSTKQTPSGKLINISYICAGEYTNCQGHVQIVNISDSNITSFFLTSRSNSTPMQQCFGPSALHKQSGTPRVERASNVRVLQRSMDHLEVKSCASKVKVNGSNSQVSSFPNHNLSEVFQLNKNIRGLKNPWIQKSQVTICLGDFMVSFIFKYPKLLGIIMINFHSPSVSDII